MVTLKDIAKKAGVSLTTASKSLNGYSDVNKDTKKKVQKIANELGYFPNATAKALKTKKNWLVGLIYEESLNIGFEHPHFSGIIESFKKVMEQNGYDTIFITGTIGKKKTSYVNHCKHRNVDGVFVCNSTDDNIYLDELFNSDIKCVTVDYKEDVPIIISDNINGSIMAFDYLYHLGHRKIAYISGSHLSISGNERLEGYKKALLNRNIRYNNKLVVEARDYDYESGYEAGKILLDKCKDDMPTGIMTASDIVAVGVMQAIKDKGLRVPEDISVIGFDNIEISKYCSPPLTTIEQNRHEIGVQAANTLLALMANKKVENRKIIPVQLIQRDSCKRIDYSIN